MNDVQFLGTQWWSLVPAWRPTTDAMRRCAAPCCHGYSLGRYSLTAINERLKVILLHSQLNCCVFNCIFIITSKLYTFFTNLPIIPILKCSIEATMCYLIHKLFTLEQSLHEVTQSTRRYCPPGMSIIKGVRVHLIVFFCLSL